MRISKIAVYGLICCSGLAAGAIPSQDIRNTYTPDTDTHFRFEAPATLQAWAQRRAVLRTQILTAAGLNPMPAKAAMHPQIYGRINRRGYTIEKVLLDTLPDYYLGGNLYRPDSEGRHPALLLAHGHWPYGRLENQQLCDPQALAATLAREGFVVFMYDMVGYDDTIQTPHKFGGDSERLWSFGPLGLQLWNSIRAMDFVSELTDVDASRIGITGPSGGGTQTMMLTAVDDRVKFDAPINMVSAYMQGGDYCENAPALRVGTNNVEIAAMAAPKPLFIVSATGDWTKHVPVEEFPAIQKVYELYGKKDAVSVVQIDAPHNLNQQSRIAVERFFAKTILRMPGAETVDEKGIATEHLEDMLALFNRSQPSGAVRYDQLFARWREESQKQMAAIEDMAQLRAVLASTMGVTWPDQLAGHSAMTGNTATIVLGREGVGDRVQGYHQRGGPSAMLLLHPDGADAARQAAQKRGLILKGHTVLAIDAFQTGAAVAPRDRSHQHFLAFNRSDDANRVQDVLTAIRFLEEQHCTMVDIYAEGAAAWWAEFAAAVTPPEIAIRLHLGNANLSDSETAYLKDFNVPGILRAGGLKTAERLLKAQNRN